MVGVVQGIISDGEQMNSITASTAVAGAAAPTQITLIKMEIRQMEDWFPSKIVPECSSKTHLSLKIGPCIHFC